MRTFSSTLVISLALLVSACRTDGPPPQTVRAGATSDPFATAGVLETLKGGGYQFKGGPRRRSGWARR